jgi:PmbA protein
MASLVDQTPLLRLAERLISAAKRAGADAADALAVRSVSQGVEVRDGAVEESSRSEHDDVGLRVMVGQRQAVVSTNDIAGDGLDALAARAVAMARAAPEDRYVGLADKDELARAIPNLDLLDPDLPSVAELERSACEAEAAALAVAGVSKSAGASASAGLAGIVLATSHGFRADYVGSRRGISMVAIAGDGTAMERDYEFSTALHAEDLDAPTSVGRIAGERAVARLNPRKVDTKRVPVVYDPRVSGTLVSHLANAVNGSSIARKTSFLREKLGEKLFAPDIRIVDDPLRPRGLRSRPFDAEGVAGRARAIVDDGVLKTLVLF